MKDSILPDCMMPDGAEPCKAYLAKCQESSEWKKYFELSDEKNRELQSKVTDLEAKVKAYEAALWDIRKCQFNDIGSWLIDRAAKALKEQAGEG